MAARFDHHVIVDWSAASRPKTGRDSIWLCHRGPRGERCENPPTRHQAKLLLADILTDVVARGERAVLGFDFPFGYPAGFAARLGLRGAPWRALWDEIARLVHDGEDNANDRFAVGAEFNRRVSGGRFPFWGCPAAASGEFLGTRHHNGHATGGLGERRLIDLWMVGAQPCWKLAYTGSVGSQSLTGIPVVRALRDDPRWSDCARVWPFETGLALPDGVQIVFAEVWPSWWREEIRTSGYGPPNDNAQVRTVAEIFAARDKPGELAAWFTGAPTLSDTQRQVIASEEAWTLGVTAPRRPRARHRAPSPPTPMRHSRTPSQIANREPEPTSEKTSPSGYSYLRDADAIYRRSFALIRAEADLARFPAALRPLALRLAHAAGDTAILGDLAWSRGAVAAGSRALANGAPILVDGAMTAAGVIRDRLPGQNPVICKLSEPAVPALAAQNRSTRSAAAVDLWRRQLGGAVVAIGNSPTALFRLLEILDDGAAWPALVLAFPVGFVGAAESKEALIAFGRGLAYVTLRGRRGGSALAAAAINALGAR